METKTLNEVATREFTSHVRRRIHVVNFRRLAPRAINGIKKFAKNKIKILLPFVVIIYIIPIIFKYSPYIQRSLLFMNNAKANFNLSQPEELGIKCSRLLRLDNSLEVNSKNIQLGAWHILPGSAIHSCATIQNDNHTIIDDEKAFEDQRPIVLYVHGNNGNRGGDYRSQLYKRLAYEHDYHVVTFDYRGYGDSTYDTPTAQGLSLDAKFMYHWLLKQPNVNKDRIIVWGHSLGAAVAVRMVADLKNDMSPRRLILEAPFDSVANAIANHPSSAPFRALPYFEYFFIEPIEKSPELNFDSSRLIGDIKTTPILILHAEDDRTIPIKLGKNLYNKAAQKLGKSRVKFISISASHEVGHRYICSHDETMSKVKEFIN